MEQIRVYSEEVKKQVYDEYESAPRRFFDLRNTFLIIETKREDETIRQYSRRMWELLRQLEREKEWGQNNLVFMERMVSDELKKRVEECLGLR